MGPSNPRRGYPSLTSSEGRVDRQRIVASCTTPRKHALGRRAAVALFAILCAAYLWSIFWSTTWGSYHGGWAIGLAHGEIHFSQNRWGDSFIHGLCVARWYGALRTDCLLPRFRSDPWTCDFYLPFWVPVLFVGMAPLRHARAKVRQEKALAAGRCIGCGYDRAGLAAEARCPECGVMSAK